MSCYYELSGRLRIKSRVHVRRVEDALLAAPGLLRAGSSVKVDGAERWLLIYVSDQMSYYEVQECENFLRGFAEDFLVGYGQVLKYSVDGQPGRLALGPEGFDEEWALIQAIRGEIEDLKQEIAGLESVRSAREAA